MHAHFVTSTLFYSLVHFVLLMLLTCVEHFAFVSVVKELTVDANDNDDDDDD